MVRKRGGIISPSLLWERHEKLYCTIFREALEKLEVDEKKRSDEDAISEVLCFLLHQVCFENERDVRPPDWEKPIQPAAKCELKGGKKRKRPDFTCDFINSYADSAQNYLVPFHVECKRLGNKKGSYNLNQNYITNGIRRFDCKEHQYGKRASSGMMIGYLVDMDGTDVLIELNSYKSEDSSELLMEFLHKVSFGDQHLTRRCVCPTRFKLIHAWVDLREIV